MFGGNRAVLAISTARMGDAVGNSMLFVILPLYVASTPAPWFPFPESVRVGFLLALYGLISSVVQPLMGALSDRMGRRKQLIVLGLSITGVSTIGFVTAKQYWDLMLCRALQGLGAAVSIPASMALMADSSAPESRGGAMGIYDAMRMGGFVIGPLIAGPVFDRFGFDTSFYTATGFIVLGIILVSVSVQDAPQAGQAPALRRCELMGVRLPAAGVLGAAFATFVMANSFAMLSTLENEFKHRLQQSTTEFSIAFGALMITRVFFQVPMGVASDRLGRKPVIMMGLILMAPATALLGEVRSTWQLAGLRVMQGLASAGIAAPALALAADASEEGCAGRQMSIVTMAFGLGITVGPLIAGVLAVFSFGLPFMVGGLLSLAGAWVVYRYVPEARNEKSCGKPVTPQVS